MKWQSNKERARERRETQRARPGSERDHKSAPASERERDKSAWHTSILWLFLATTGFGLAVNVCATMCVSYDSWLHLFPHTYTHTHAHTAHTHTRDNTRCADAAAFADGSAATVGDDSSNYVCVRDSGSRAWSSCSGTRSACLLIPHSNKADGQAGEKYKANLVCN